MPFEALSAKARLIVPVGAMESRCEFLIPDFFICSLIEAGRRAAKLVPDKYKSALKSGKAPRSCATRPTKGQWSSPRNAEPFRFALPSCICPAHAFPRDFRLATCD